MKQTSAICRVRFFIVIFIVVLVSTLYNPPRAYTILGGTLIDPEESGFVEVLGGCSGTLLTNEWVFSAIHCFQSTEKKNPAMIEVTMGSQTSYGIVYESNIGSGGALVRVSPPFTINGSSTDYWRGFYRGSDDSLLGKQLNCYGYGNSRYIDNSSASCRVANTQGQMVSNVTGFGDLRTAILEVIPDTGNKCNEDCYSLSVNIDGQIHMTGDSGSSCLYNMPNAEPVITGGHWHGNCATYANQLSSTLFREWSLHHIYKDNFGSAVVAGDFSGDGYPDLAIGFPGGDTASTHRTGIVGIYIWTGNGFQYHSTLTQAGLGVDETNDSFGYSLATGDFDGDGLDDLAVGAPFETPGESVESGYVFVYKAVVNTSDSLELQPWQGLDQDGLRTKAMGDRFGYSLATGDFDGDGLDDLAVGAPTAGAGTVLVYTGSSAGLDPWQTLDQSGLGANEGGDRFGYSLAAGDFNGDGNDDLAIGTPSEDVSGAHSGYVWLFQGNSSQLMPWGSGLSQATGIDDLDENENAEMFGWALAAGDFDGDGLDDLAVGTPREFNQGERTGTVFLYHGTAYGLDPWNMILQSMGSNELGDFFGASLAVGDLNRDGLDDLAVGVPLEQVGTVESGYIYVYSGSIPYGVVPWMRVGQETLASQNWTNEPGDFFGSALAIAIGPNSSIPNHILVGAPGETLTGNPVPGAVYDFRIDTGNAPVDGQILHLP